jgi:hypothetical protein
MQRGKSPDLYQVLDEGRAACIRAIHTYYIQYSTVVYAAYTVV